MLAVARRLQGVSSIQPVCLVESSYTLWTDDARIVVCKYSCITFMWDIGHTLCISVHVVSSCGEPPSLQLTGQRAFNGSVFVANCCF